MNAAVATAALPDLADLVNELFRAAHRPGARNANNPNPQPADAPASTVGGWKPPSTARTPRTPRTPKE